MRALLSIGSVAILCGLVHAQPRRLPEPDIKIDATVRGQVIDAAIAALGARYVFPDVAKQIEVSLRDRVKAHTYDTITSSMGFAEQLTKDLQAVSHDKHMRIFYSSSPIPPDRPDEAPASPEDKAREHVIAARFNGAFVKVERLDGNIGVANPGGPSKVGEHFALFVPMGRAISPVTKTNWEGTGVHPDIMVPAAKALDAAYLVALKLQRAKYTVEDAPNLRDEIDQGIKRLEGRK